MSYLPTDLLEALAQKQDIEEVFHRHLETAINQLLKHESMSFLDYEPYEQAGVNSGIPVTGSTAGPLRQNTATLS